MSYESALEELKAQGITPPSINSVQTTQQQMLSEQERKIIENMEIINGHPFSEEQKNILKKKGSAVIIACAGSGKTTIITNMIAKRIANGEIVNTNRMICTTFSKGGATEMDERLHQLLQKFGMDRPIKVSTLHSFFLSIIRTFGIDMSIIDEGTRLRYIAEAAKEAQLELRDNDLQDLSNLISFQINNLMSDDKALRSNANTLENMTKDQYALVRRGYANKKSAKAQIDFDDMQMFMYKWIVKNKESENPVERNSALQVKAYCQATWDYFYIDEAQDISKIQFAIIREMVTDMNDKNKLAKELIFVGDDDQSIYGWRGADSSIILNVGTTFNMEVLKLSTNYRCRENIVKFAANSIKNNTNRYDKSMEAFNKGGDIKIAVVKQPDLNTLSTVAFEFIKFLINDLNVSPSKICVMARNNFHLAILSNMMLHAGLYTSSTQDMKLTSSTLYKDIKAIIELADTHCKDSNVTKKILWRLVRYMSIANSQVIASFQESMDLSLRDTLGYMLVHLGGETDITFDKDYNVPVLVKDKLRYKYNSLSLDTKKVLVGLYTILSSDDEIKRLFGLMTMYMDCAGALLYRTEDKQRSLKGICNYIYLLVRDYGYQNTVDFLRITEQYEQGGMFIPGDKVTLTTVHSAKGKEWDVVVNFAVDNTTMPGKQDVYNMLSKGDSIVEVNDYIDEERRLYYVEGTRGKLYTLYITVEIPSIFLMESLQCKINDTESTNYKFIENMSDSPQFEEAEFWKIFNKDKFNSLVLDENGEYYYSLEKEKQRFIKLREEGYI